MIIHSNSIKIKNCLADNFLKQAIVNYVWGAQIYYSLTFI